MALRRQRTLRFDEEMGMPPPPIQQEQAALPASIAVASSGDIPIQQKQAAFPAIKLGVASSGNNKIFDPSSGFILTWNCIFLFSCLLALFVDPLYFYVPKIVYGTPYSCVGTDRHLTIIVTLLRSITDLLYAIHIILKFRTAIFKKSSTLGISKGGYFVRDPREIAWKYLRSDFAIDVVAALPLPQIIVWYLIPAIKYSNAEPSDNILVLIVLAQYLPRLYLIFPLTYEIIKATEVVAKTAWQGAVYSLLLYMITSHVLGAVWYLLSVDRQTACWKMSCRNETGCDIRYLDCDMAPNQKWASTTDIFHSCNASDTSITFDYGMFLPALSNLVPAQGFLIKLFYSLWWGLQNLSCYGQTISVSTYIGETLFGIFLAVFSLALESSGLVLCVYLIGNVQTSLQSITVREDEWRLKQRDTEEWMTYRQLPGELRERVRKFIQYKWLLTRGVDEEYIFQVLPEYLRREIRRHLCLDLVRRVPFFCQMDDQLLDAIFARLVSSPCTKSTYIIREGDPVTEMLFIIRGKLESATTDGGRTGFFNSVLLKSGDCCGEELLGWTFIPEPTSLPTATCTVKALTDVEAFSLQAEDLRFVASQFGRWHSKKLQHTFRYYSPHWRTWSACFIQAALRRYMRRKMEKGLRSEDSNGEEGPPRKNNL
uniref:Cyclic nucleotide-binding domain-containing protein n=2 Tax=Triticum urartu TaxID=4572 RepID=A0A8R7UWM6_TRIUA